MADYISPFGKPANTSGGDYISPFQGSQYTPEYWVSFKKQVAVENAIKDFSDIANKDYNTQINIVNNLRTLGVIDEQQRKDLQMGIIYNDRIAKGQGPGVTKVDMQPGKLAPSAQATLRGWGVENIPVVKSIVKPFMTPQTDIKANIKNNQNLVGVTPEYQKYINELGQKVIESNGRIGVQDYNKALEQAEKIAKNNMQTISFIKSPANYITTYNKMNSLEQRSVINDLANTIRDYKGSTDKELKDLADKSKILLGYLTGSKKDIEDYNKILGLPPASVPEVKTQKDVITFGLDIGRNLVGTAKDFANVMDQSIRANLNNLWAKANRTKLFFNPDLQPFLTDKWTTNLNAYKSGQIDKRTFELNNARIDDWFERALTTDPSFKARLAKSVGWGAYGASFFIPTAAFLKGGKFVLSAMVGDVVANGALNSLTTLIDYSKEKPLKASDFATNFGVGMLFAMTPYLYHGVKTGVIRAKIGKLPGGEDFAAKLDSAADQDATGRALVETFGQQDDPELKAAAIDAVEQNLTPQERAAINNTAKKVINETTDIVENINNNVVLEGVVETADTAQTITPTTATVTETPSISTQIAEEINAKKNIFVEDTGTKVGNAKEFRIVDTNGNNLGVIKANTIQAASARLQQIQASPTRYSKKYPGVFEQPKQTAAKAARVTKEKAPAPTTKPTAVRRPAFMPEGYVVLEKSRTQPNGKITTEFILRDAEGREIRRLTTSEIRRYREYTKARIEAFRASQATGKAQTQLEAARAEARAAQEQARIDAGLQPSVVRGREKAETIIEASGMGKQKPSAKKVAEDNLRERPTIKNGKPVIQTIDSEGNVVKTTEVKTTEAAAEMGKQKPTIIKEKGVVKVEVPAKQKPAPKTEAKPVPAMPTPPKTKETITRGANRTILQDIESGYRNTFPDKFATFQSLKGEIKDKLIPKYEQDIINDLDYVIDVITGRRMPENNVQQELYTVLLQNFLQKGGDPKTWRKINNAVNLAGSYSHRAVSESAQKLAAVSLVEQKYNINSIINRIEKERIGDKKAFWQARGTTYEKVLAKERESIVNAIPEVTAEDNLKLIKSYKEKSFGPLLKAFVEGKISLAEFSKMTPDRRLSVLTDILKDEDLALRYASDFEKKLLLKNQKLGLINWLKSDIKMDPTLKKDIITQVLELENVLDPTNAGKFDNFINTKLGLRLTGAQQEKLFTLQAKVQEKEIGIIKKYGDANKRLKAAANLVDTKYLPGGKRINWERSAADLEYGEALADTMIFLRDVQTKSFVESLQQLKDVQATKAGYQALKDINDTMRALQSSLDNSFLLRQGMQTLKVSPTTWLKGAQKSYESIINVIDDPIKAEKTFMAYMLADPWTEVASRNGLAVLTKDDIFSPAVDPSNWKVVGRVYKGSALAYDAAAQHMRLELFKKFYTVDMLNLEKMNAKEIAKRAKDSNYTKLEMPKDYPKNLATYINALTGRGTLGGLEPSARTLNLWFYSARFLASQLQKMVAHPLGATIGGVTIKNEAGKLFWNPVHKRASTNLMKIAITTAAMMGIANALKPGSAELDPRSADFGKIKVGNTRFDITGGMGQFVVLLARTLPAFLPGIDAYTKNSNTGLLTKLNSQEYGSKDSFDVVMEFFQNKTSPLARNFVTQLKGVDINRMRPTLGGKLEDIIQPMVVSNFRELISDKPSSVIQKFIAALLDVHGLAANTYAGAGQGRRGASWEISNAKDILAFKEQVGDEEFRKAAKKADDQFNALVLKLIEDPEYQKADSEFKADIIRLAKAEIEKNIFKTYGFKYKPDTMTKTERQIRLNLINKNL